MSEITSLYFDQICFSTFYSVLLQVKSTQIFNCHK